VRLPEPYTFFIDRSLGGHVVADGLRGSGEKVRVHDDLFAQDTDDEVWLADVGQRRWVVLTKDVLIRRDSLQRRALLAANVAAFVLARGDVSGSVMASAFVTALPLDGQVFDVLVTHGLDDQRVGELAALDDLRQRRRGDDRVVVGAGDRLVESLFDEDARRDDVEDQAA
jgi:hypothetical protein